MSYTAEVLQILIASPSDVAAHRDQIERAIYEWNNEHSEEYGIVLLPKRWEKDLMPNYAYGDVQGEINNQIVNSADMVIGVFGYRFGSPTKHAPSGTIEELNIFIESNKPVMLYFDEPEQVEIKYVEQAALLEKFKKDYAGKGIYFKYEDEHQIRKHLLQQVKRYKADKLQTRERIMRAVISDPTVNPSSKSLHSNSAEKVITESDRSIPRSADAILDDLDLDEKKADSSTNMIHQISFNYSNNNGFYTIGTGIYEFQTRWSKSSDISIHAYKTGNISKIGYRHKTYDMPLHYFIPDFFDFSSDSRTIRVGEIMIWVNDNNKLLYTKVIKVVDNSRSSSNGEDDKVTLEYFIYEEDFDDLPNL